VAATDFANWLRARIAEREMSNGRPMADLGVVYETIQARRSAARPKRSSRPLATRRQLSERRADPRAR
jgi:hypothetical protein